MTPEQEKILRSLANGSTLKMHRTLDGAKIYRLHPLHDAPPEVLPDALVESLRQQKLIQSNLKFPAAVYLLTDKGMAVARTLATSTELPVSSKNYSQ